MSEPAPPPPEPPPTLHYQRPIPNVPRQDGGARETGCVLGAVVPLTVVVALLAVGRQVMSAVGGLYSFVVREVAAVPYLVLGWAVILVAGIAFAGRVFFRRRSRRPRRPRTPGYRWDQFALGCSFAAAGWLTLIGLAALALYTALRSAW